MCFSYRTFDRRRVSRVCEFSRTIRKLANTERNTEKWSQMCNQQKPQIWIYSFFQNKNREKNDNEKKLKSSKRRWELVKLKNLPNAPMCTKCAEKKKPKRMNKKKMIRKWSDINNSLAPQISNMKLTSSITLFAMAKFAVVVVAVVWWFLSFIMLALR